MCRSQDCLGWNERVVKGLAKSPMKTMEAPVTAQLTPSDGMLHAGGACELSRGLQAEDNGPKGDRRLE